jgi:tetratricopeptide (TPR) repeat protein
LKRGCFIGTLLLMAAYVYGQESGGGRYYLNNTGNTADPAYAEVLINTAFEEENADKAITLLLRYKKNIVSIEGQSAAAAALAVFYELINNFERAGHFYDEAYHYSRPVNYHYLLKAGFLSAEQGEHSEAIGRALTVLKSRPEKAEKNEALTLFFTACRLGRAVKQGEAMIEKEKSFINKEADAALLYALYRYYKRFQRDGEAAGVGQLLVQRYPHSPEALLIKQAVGVFPSPVNIF